MTLILNQALHQAYRALAPQSRTPAADAQVLLAHICGQSRAWVIAHPETCLTATQISALETACERLLNREPLPYVLGQWEFFGLTLAVTPAVLIPRPETEHLVEAALAWLDAHPSPGLIIDIGTGSGCIAIALASNRPNLKVVASDISASALKVASRNVHIHNLTDRVHLVQADLLPPLSQPPALLCANLPYIPTLTLMDLPVSQHEPILALDGGMDGMVVIRRLLQQVSSLLAPGGRLLLEIEAHQGLPVLELIKQTFPGDRISLNPDLAGHDRLIMIDR